MSLENREFQEHEDILIEEFNAWKEILQARGEGFAFDIDRENDQEAKFAKKDRHLVFMLNSPLEELNEDQPPNFQKTAKDESWIKMKIVPNDTYRSKIAMYMVNGEQIYYTEELSLYFSNKGRAYQKISLEPIFNIITSSFRSSPITLRRPNFYSLKSSLDEIDVIKLNARPSISARVIESFRPLTALNFERLGFLREQIQNNNPTLL